MAAVIFVLLLVVLARLSAGYSIPDYPGEELNDWPEACKGRNYCWKKNRAYELKQHIIDDLLRNQSLEYRLGDEVGDRVSEVNDIGNCKPTIPELKTIYLIKDQEGTVWYVPQTANYNLRIQIEECTKLGRIQEADHTGMIPSALVEKQVHCLEQRVDFKFPVLYRDNNDPKYKIKLMSPHRGLPLSCSTKICQPSGCGLSD